MLAKPLLTKIAVVALIMPLLLRLRRPAAASEKSIAIDPALVLLTLIVPALVKLRVPVDELL